MLVRRSRSAAEGPSRIATSGDAAVVRSLVAAARGPRRTGAELRGDRAPGKLGSEAAVPALGALLDDLDQEVRDSAAKALGGMRRSEQADRCAGPRAVRAAAATCDVASSRPWADAPHPSITMALTEIVLNDAGTLLGEGAAKALRRRRDPNAWIGLVGDLVGPELELRRRAARGLASLGPPPEAAGRLWTVLADASRGDDLALRLLIADEMCPPGETRRSCGCSPGMITDPSPAARVAALAGLSRIGSEGAIQALAAVLEGHGDAAMRKEAAGGLRGFGTAAALGALMGALGDDDEEVRRAAGVALSAPEAGPCVPALVFALEHGRAGRHGRRRRPRAP